MKLKVFAAIVETCASNFELCGRIEDARDVRQFVADLKPFARRDLAGFFTAFSRTEADSGDHSHASRIQVKLFAKSIETAGQLLDAAGAKAKGRELASTAAELGNRPEVPVHALLERVKAAQEVAKREEIAKLVSRLEDSQRVSEQFEKVVTELAKLTPDIVSDVAVGYVQGKSKYSSKPKALAAIRDKQYERARLANKMSD